MENKANNGTNGLGLTRYEKIKIGILAGTGLVLTGIGIYVGVKFGGISNKLDMSVSDLSKATNVDISEKLVESATKKACENAANKMAKKAAEEVSEEMGRAIKSQVSEAIKNSYSSIKGSVAKEVKDQVARMSISDLREEIKDEAKDLIQERLQDDIDEVLEDYSSQLESVGKIYDSIASKLSQGIGGAGSVDKGISLKLG